jgi:hypothetical protein
MGPFILMIICGAIFLSFVVGIIVFAIFGWMKEDMSLGRLISIPIVGAIIIYVIYKLCS